ncbi:MAG TPA: hypothetical protein VMT68_12330 [Caulobacteraceae bacterium]|nr:hypothetical protein [Caulobacteraceae bacterium]
MTTAIADIVGRLLTSGKIAADDVLAMRKEIYGAPKIAPDDADALARLDLAATERAPEWGEFFAEVMVDYVVRQQDPEDYVDDATAAWLMRAFDGDLKRDSAIEALARIVETSSAAPPALATFALDKLKARVVAAGTIGAGDVALLRRLVFAGGGDGNIGVTRAEADVLFDIRDACGTSYAPEWIDFFAKAIADAVTVVSPFQLESRDAALKDGAWLNERESPLGFARGMLHAPDVGGAMKDVLDPFADEAKEWREADDAIDAAEAAAAPVSEDEANWLVRRLGPDPKGEPEQRLIKLLRQTAPRWSDVLRPLLGAPPAPQAPAGPVVFGRRPNAAA